MKTAHAISIAMFALMSCTGWADQATNSLSPKEYLDLHIAASDLKNSKWADSMRTLAKVGDAFTLEHLKSLGAQPLDAGQVEILNQTLSATRERVAKEDVQTFTSLIQVRLERAAWADLMCNKLEGPLVSWTLKNMGEHLGSPEVVAELKRIQSRYVPSVEAKTLFSSIQQRVPSYATRVLGAAAAAENPKNSGTD